MTKAYILTYSHNVCQEQDLLRPANMQQKNYAERSTRINYMVSLLVTHHDLCCGFLMVRVLVLTGLLSPEEVS